MVKLKARAASLIEVVISMSLASMVFSIGIMIYLNVVRSLPFGYQDLMNYECQFQLDSMAATISPVENSSISYPLNENLTVIFTYNKYDEERFADTWWLTCMIEDTLNNFSERHKIIYHAQTP